LRPFERGGEKKGRVTAPRGGTRIAIPSEDRGEVLERKRGRLPDDKWVRSSFLCSGGKQGREEQYCVFMLRNAAEDDGQKKRVLIAKQG